MQLYYTRKKERREEEKEKPVQITNATPTMHPSPCLAALQETSRKRKMNPWPRQCNRSAIDTIAETCASPTFPSLLKGACINRTKEKVREEKRREG
jgi:hypothetical protein